MIHRSLRFGPSLEVQAGRWSSCSTARCPREAKKFFRSAGLSLFPERSSDLQTDSCTDWSNPCKYIAAVYYLPGEEFDRDPFLIFKPRGIDREEFLGLLGENRSATPTTFTADEAPAAEPLLHSPALFWNGGAISENLIEGVVMPTAGAALPRRLGKFPFWGGSEDLFDALERVYRSAAANVVRVLSQE